MPTALDVCRVAAIKPPATDLLASATDARNFVDLLMAQNYWMEAVAYLSHAITARESIWWAWFCARKAAQGKEDPGATSALAVAEAWIAQPTEENRIKARKTAEREPNGSPARAVLEAIDATGELTNEANGERLPAVPFLSSKFVQVAVLNSVYQFDPETPQRTAADFIKQGLEVANRIQLWARFS